MLKVFFIVIFIKKQLKLPIFLIFINKPRSFFYHKHKKNSFFFHHVKFYPCLAYFFANLMLKLIFCKKKLYLLNIFVW